MCQVLANGIGKRTCEYLTNNRNRSSDDHCSSTGGNALAFQLQPKIKKNSHGLKHSEQFFLVVMRNCVAITGHRVTRRNSIVMKHMASQKSGIENKLLPVWLTG